MSDDKDPSVQSFVAGELISAAVTLLIVPRNPSMSFLAHLLGLFASFSSNVFVYFCDISVEFASRRFGGFLSMAGCF